MGCARLLVSFELLRECLHLPLGTVIHFATTETNDFAELTVSHPALREVLAQEREKLPLVSPRFHRNERGDVAFIDWGQT